MAEVLPIHCLQCGFQLINICKPVYPDCIESTDNKWVLKDQPKTYAGYRDIPLPPEVMDKLKGLCKGQTPETTGFGIIGLSPNAIYQHSTISSEDAAAALITEKLRKMKWASIADET